MKVKPFAPMERALRDFILQNFDFGTSPAHVARDLPGDVDDLYIRVERRPGGRADQIQGDFVFDVEVFHPKYTRAESAASDLEALLLGYPHTVKVGDQHVVFDQVTENQGPSETFWDDDDVHRLLATYVITARR